MVCCGFLVCWSPNEISFFVNFVGYPIDFGGWFYHFTTYQSIVVRTLQTPYLLDFTSVDCTEVGLRVHGCTVVLLDEWTIITKIHTNLRCSNYWVKYTLICALAILLPLWLVCNLVLPLHFIGCYDVTFNLATILPTPFITPFQHIAFPYSKDISQVCTFYHLAYLSSIRLSLSSAGVGVVIIWSWFWCSKTLVYITVRLSLHRLMARDRFLVCLLLAPKSVTVASCCCLFAVKNFFVMSVLMSVVGNVLISGWCPSISLHCWSQGLWSWS